MYDINEEKYVIVSFRNYLLYNKYGIDALMDKVIVSFRNYLLYNRTEEQNF